METLITALGVYAAELNGHRIGSGVLSPGWTNYGCCLQVQRYGITDLLQENSVLRITIGREWSCSSMPDWLTSKTWSGGSRNSVVFLRVYSCILQMERRQ